MIPNVHMLSSINDKDDDNYVLDGAQPFFNNNLINVSKKGRKVFEYLQIGDNISLSQIDASLPELDYFEYHVSWH